MERVLPPWQDRMLPPCQYTPVCHGHTHSHDMPRLPWWCGMLPPVAIVLYGVSPPWQNGMWRPCVVAPNVAHPVATRFSLQHGMLAPVAAWQHGTNAIPVATSNVTPVPTHPRLSWPHPIPLPWQHGMLLLRQRGANVITLPTCHCYPRHSNTAC